MFQQIRTSFARKAIQAFLSNNRRSRTVHTLRTAASIGLLFDATDAKKAAEIAEWAKTIEKQGKKISLLGFVNEKVKADAPKRAFETFSVKETRFNYAPTSAKAIDFAAQSFDLLLCFNPLHLPALDWVAAQSKAKMKAGLASPFSNDYDIQLDIPEPQGIQYFAQQLNMYSDTFSAATLSTPKGS